MTVKSFPLGVAISSESKTPDELITDLKSLLNLEDSAVELSLTVEEKLQHVWNQDIFTLVKKFHYRSIHAPVKTTDGRLLSYPSSKGKQLLEIIDGIAKGMQADTVLFHPDLITDFTYLNQKYGSRLAFENMDQSKPFGKTIEDLEMVFQQSPQAKWVFDINHSYTTDPTMTSAAKFYTHFKDRLCHYHISSFGGFHDCFVNTHEDIILQGIKDLKHPFIHEGHCFQKGIWLAEKEYIERMLSERDDL